VLNTTYGEQAVPSAKRTAETRAFKKRTVANFRDRPTPAVWVRRRNFPWAAIDEAAGDRQTHASAGIQPNTSAARTQISVAHGGRHTVPPTLHAVAPPLHPIDPGDSPTRDWTRGWLTILR